MSAVPVGAVQIPVGGHRQVGGHVEGLAALLRGVLVGPADGKEELPLLGPDTLGVVSCIAGVHVPVGAHGDPMGRAEVVTHAAPGVQEVPILVENEDHRVVAPGQQVDVVVPVHAHVGPVDEGSPARPLEEWLDDLEPVLSASEGWHRDPLLGSSRLLGRQGSVRLGLRSKPIRGPPFAGG